MLHFLAQINRQKATEMCLSWLAIKGNKLKGDSTPEHQLKQTLSDLILKPYLQHLDLGLTDISPEVVRTCM